MLDLREALSVPTFSEKIAELAERGAIARFQRKERETMIYVMRQSDGVPRRNQDCEASMRQFLRDRQRSVDSKVRKAIQAGASRR